MNHYQTLGISPGATDEEIKKAFRKLAHIHHPDKGGDAEKFKKINHAYTELLKGNGRMGTPSPHQGNSTVHYGFHTHTYRWDPQTAEYTEIRKKAMADLMRQYQEQMQRQMNEAQRKFYGNWK